MEATPRLSVEKLAGKHASIAFPHLQDKEIYRYIPDRPPSNVDLLTEHYERLAVGSSVSSEIWHNWILLERHSNNFVGTIQATVLPQQAEAFIAYVLISKMWGQGYGTEALSWLVERLTSKYKLNRVIAEIDTRNNRSIKLVEKHDFLLTETTATEEGEDHIYVKNIKDH